MTLLIYGTNGKPKRPVEPKKPIKPSAPIKTRPVREQLFIDINKSISLASLVESIGKQASSELSFNDIFIELEKYCGGSYGDYDCYCYCNIAIYYNKNIENDQYDKELEQYNNKLQAYKLKLGIYEEKLKLYKDQLEEYNKYLNEVEIKKLERELKKLKNKTV